MNPKTLPEILKAIKAAPTVFVGCALTHDDVHYFRVSKAEALDSVRHFAREGSEENEHTWRVRIDPADMSVWIG